MSSYAYKLDQLKRYHLIEGQNEAITNNEFKNFKDLGKKNIRIIHGFPKSFEDGSFEVSDMEIYIGVSLSDQLFKRFSAHKDSKDHEYGVILGTFESGFANYLEKVGIKLLKKLENKNNLCVKNQKAGGYNYIPNESIGEDELIFFYMTVKINKLKSNNWIKPNLNERQEIKIELFDDLKGEVLNRTDKNHIADVVDSVHLASDNEKVTWKKEHRD
jgi:hypothetical protein